MRKGIHLDLGSWLVPGQILTGKPPPGCRYRGVDPVLISAVAYNNPIAIHGGAECHHCEHPQLRCSMHFPEAYTSIT